MYKDPSNEYSALLTIDTGVDATHAILDMIKQVEKTPDSLISFCGDGDGTNTGHINGVKGQVSYSLSNVHVCVVCNVHFLTTLLTVLCPTDYQICTTLSSYMGWSS